MIDEVFADFKHPDFETGMKLAELVKKTVNDFIEANPVKTIAEKKVDQKF